MKRGRRPNGTVAMTAAERVAALRLRRANEMDALRRENEALRKKIDELESREGAAFKALVDIFDCLGGAAGVRRVKTNPIPYSGEQFLPLDVPYKLYIAAAKAIEIDD